MRNDGVLRRAKSAKTPLLLLLPRSIKEKTRARIFVSAIFVPSSSQVKFKIAVTNPPPLVPFASAIDREGRTRRNRHRWIAPVGKGRRLGSRRVCKTYGDGGALA